MYKRTIFFELFFLNCLTTYIDNWPLTATEIIGFLPATFVALALGRDSYNNLRAYIPAYWKGFIYSREEKYLW